MMLQLLMMHVALCNLCKSTRQATMPSVLCPPRVGALLFFDEQREKREVVCLLGF